MSRKATLAPRIYCFAGPDGVGKTTLVNSVARLLTLAGKKPVLVWIRYNHYFSKGVLAFARLAGMTHIVREQGAVVHKYHRFHKHPLISRIFLWCKAIDTVLASIVKIWLPLLLDKRAIILCDRWVLDVIVDVTVETGMEHIEETLPGKWLHDLMNHAQGIVLIADSKQLLERRRENRFDPFLQQRLAAYQRLSEYYGLPLLRAAHPLQTLREAIRQSSLNVYGLESDESSEKQFVSETEL